MQNLPPDMLREELWHPLVAHFPVALLIIGSLFFLTSLILPAGDKFSFIRPAARVLIILGSVGAWIAIYTGNLADVIVGRTLCDPTVLEEHERFAEITAFLFSGGIVFELLIAYLKTSKLIAKAATFAVLALIITGTGTLSYVGHLGSKLVYQQAAAVYHPSEDCSEFEDE